MLAVPSRLSSGVVHFDHMSGLLAAVHKGRRAKGALILHMQAPDVQAEAQLVYKGRAARLTDVIPVMQIHVD